MTLTLYVLPSVAVHSNGASASDIEMRALMLSGSVSSRLVPSSTLPGRGHRAGTGEQRLGQRGLADSAVAHQHHVVNPLGRVGRHRMYPHINVSVPVTVAPRQGRRSRPKGTCARAGGLCAARELERDNWSPRRESNP